MGELWIAEHLGLGADVVVKCIAPEHLATPGAAARFAAEAAAAARVHSPYVVRVLDYGLAPDGRPYLVMEKLEGRDLATHLAVEPTLDPALAARLVIQVARGLAAAHALGIVHRDVKPSNVFLCDAHGELAAKLLDFGVAKMTRDAPSATCTAGWLGTPAYMSPEQIVGAAHVDARTDQWSLGVLAFECLTGRRPFPGETAGAVALAIHAQALPRPSALSPHLPKEVDEWFGRACAREASDRFSSVIELADGLARALGVPALARLDATASTAPPPDAPATRTMDGVSARPESDHSHAPPKRRRARAWILPASIAAALAIASVASMRSGAPARQRVPPRAAQEAPQVEPAPLPELHPTVAVVIDEGAPDAARPPPRPHAASRVPLVPPLRAAASVSPPPAESAPASETPAADPEAPALFVMPNERH